MKINVIAAAVRPRTTQLIAPGTLPFEDRFIPPIGDAGIGAGFGCGAREERIGAIGIRVDGDEQDVAATVEHRLGSVPVVVVDVDDRHTGSETFRSKGGVIQVAVSAVLVA